MHHHELYEQCLGSIPEQIQKCYELGKRPTLGYTSDLDVLVQWDANTFNTMVQAHLNAKPSFRSGDMLANASDFVRVVCFLILNGLGGEVEITNRELCAWLKRTFQCTYALGGTCAQGSAALAQVGIPILTQISDRSKAVCQFLDYPQISMVSPTGKLVSVAAMITEREPVEHFILQYRHGDVVRIGNTDHIIPISNRLIMDFDDMHKTLPVDAWFLDYVEAHAMDIPSYNISGFNAIVEQQVLKQTLEKMREHYRRVKESNPDCVLYLESAHYLNPQCRQMVYEAFTPYLDILGMNEEELADLAQANGHSLIYQNAESLLATLEKIHDAYPAKGLVVHSKDYSVYYGNPRRGMDIARALCYGNLLSGTRARIGHYGSMQDCAGTLELPLSPVGIAFAQQLPQTHRGRNVCIVPSRYMEKPVTTIGLGDTFVAGMQIAFI